MIKLEKARKKIKKYSICYHHIGCFHIDLGI